MAVAQQLGTLRQLGSNSFKESPAINRSERRGEALKKGELIIG
jgi:hypothetical protein